MAHSYFSKCKILFGIFYKALIAFIFFYNACYSQILQGQYYSINSPQPQFTIGENDRGTIIISTSDHGICIGGKIEYITDPYGTQLRPAYSNYILKADSDMNQDWSIYYGLINDYNDVHNVDGLQETFAGNYFYSTDIDLIGNPSMVNSDSSDGTSLWRRGPYADAAGRLFKVSDMLKVSDTILVAGLSLDNNGNGAYSLLFALNSTGDTIYTKDYTPFVNSYVSSVSLDRDNYGNIYFLVLSSDSNSNSISILNINSSGIILDQHTIVVVVPPGRYIDMKNFLCLSPNSFLFQRVYSNLFEVYDSTGTKTDSCNIGCSSGCQVHGLNGDILSNLQVTGSCNMMLPPGSYFVDFDSNFNLKWGIFTGIYNLSDFVQSDDSTYYGTGSVSISNHDQVVCLKFRRPTGITSLNYIQTILCSPDSIEISAPISSSYLWSNGETTQNIYAKSPGDYYAFLFDQNGNFILSDTVKISEQNTLNLGNDTTVCNSQSILLNAGSGYSYYQWQDGSTSQTLNASTTSIGIDSLYYSVAVIDTNNCIYTDSILVVFDVCSGTGAEINEDTFIIYPNPASQFILIKASLTQKIINLRIFNSFGQIIYTNKTFPKQGERIELTDVAEGLYTVVFSFDQMEIRKRFVVVR